jgi:hypothetical protein
MPIPGVKALSLTWRFDDNVQIGPLSNQDKIYDLFRGILYESRDSAVRPWTFCMSSETLPSDPGHSMLGQMLPLQMCGQRLPGQICGRPAAADMLAAQRPAEARANMLPAAAAAKNPVSGRRLAALPARHLPTLAQVPCASLQIVRPWGFQLVQTGARSAQEGLDLLIPYVLQCSNALHLNRQNPMQGATLLQSDPAPSSPRGLYRFN